MHWFVVQVASQHERKVKSYLEKRKLDGLTGKIGRIVIPEREGEHIFPGYIFIEADQWPEYYLCSLTTRHKVLGQVDEEEVMRTLTMPAKPKIQKGDIVEVLSGPFAGWSGTVQSATSKKARIAITFMGQEVSVDADVERLKRVSGNALPEHREDQGGSMATA